MIYGVRKQTTYNRVDSSRSDDRHYASHTTVFKGFVLSDSIPRYHLLDLPHSIDASS